MSMLEARTAESQVQVFGGEANKTERSTRQLGLAMRRGFRCRCPNCGEGKLFRSFVKPVDHCSVCNESYTAQRADDLPAYLTIAIIGHFVIAGCMVLEGAVDIPLWLHMLIWVPITILLSLLLLQPIKGATIGLQWALFMHGFGGQGDGDFDEVT